MFDQDFGFLARNLEQSVNLYRMSIGADGTEQMELVVGEATKMFPAGGILCKRSGFGDYENQYFWQSKVFDGKLFLGIVRHQLPARAARPVYQRRPAAYVA